MEESSEKRRERLRAMREEASLAGHDEGGGGVPSAAKPSDAPGLPLLSDLQLPSVSPSPRFEFYTDPLAAFSVSQRKKSRNSFGSPYGGAPPREAPASPLPLRQPSFAPPNPPGTSFSTPAASFSSINRTPNPNSNPNLTPPSSFSPSHGANNQTSRPPSGMATTPGHFNSPYSYPNHSSIPRGNFYPGSTPPGGFSTPSSVPHSNPGSSAYAPRSAPYNYNGALYANSPAPHHYSGGRGSYSAESAQRHTNSPAPHHYSGGRGSYVEESSQRHVGGVSPNHGQSHDSNRSWGSKHSPGAGTRGTPERARGRGFQRSFSESATPTSFAKRSMLEDPWKDLVPVRVETVAFRLDSCSGSSSLDWLPKSVNRLATPPTKEGVSVCISGPSLAESLAASFADAVAGEEGA